LENIVSKLLGLEFRYEFEFDNQSANTFTEAIQALQVVPMGAPQPKITFGKTF
jgi:hypothetical protein